MQVQQFEPSEASKASPSAKLSTSLQDTQTSVNSENGEFEG
jgi:hypothetical protein